MVRVRLLISKQWRSTLVFSAMAITSAGTVPGGWLAMINSFGTVVQMAHESIVYSSNDTFTAYQPHSDVLTGNTMQKREDIIVLSGDVVISNAGTLVFPTFGATVATFCNEVNPAQDDFESYTDGSAVNGLNGGTGWVEPWVNRSDVPPAQDDFESYTNGASVQGLNGGVFWGDAYVARP